MTRSSVSQGMSVFSGVTNTRDQMAKSGPPEVRRSWAREVRFLLNASPPLLMPVSRFLVILEISEGQGHSGIGR